MIQAALRDMNAAVSLDPENILGYRGHGQVYYALGDCQRAVPDLRQVMRKKPSEEIKFALATCGTEDGSEEN